MIEHNCSRPEQDWEKIADHLMKSVHHHAFLNNPQPTIVLAKQRDDIYFGSIQEIVPEFSKEIVLLSKTSNPIPNQLAKVLYRYKLLEYSIDDSLDISGRQHVLRCVENRLTKMTDDQMKYVIKHLPKVYELNI